MTARIGHRILTTLLLLAIAATAFAQKENLETVADVHHLTAYFVAAMEIMVFVMIFTNRLYYYREHEVTKRVAQLNTQLSLVLGSNKVVVWTYDTQKRLYTIIREGGNQKTDYTTQEFAQFFAENDFNTIRSLIADICDEEKEQGTVEVKARKRTDATSFRTFRTTISILQRTQKGEPLLLIGTAQDVTDESTRQRKAKENALRYQTVFNSSLADMLFYNQDGILTDLNDKALETFKVTDRKALLARKIHISDVPSYRDVDFKNLKESLLISSITDITKVKQEDERMPEVKAKGKFYYEVNVSPIRNKDGELQGIVAAGNDITEMVESHHQQRQDSETLKKTIKDIEQYISNINYTLQASGVRLINYNPETHELNILSDLNNTQYQLSQIRCASLVDESERRRLRGLFLRMDRKEPDAINETLRTIFRDKQGRSIYLAFSLISITDANNKVTHYTGLLRDDTEMVYTEKRLLEETKKAQETEELKNTFLTNMSHEIRTPLNAVIGFAELFNGPHDEEDEPVFAQEIKRNTGDLLALINDILFISRLDARMVEINCKETDFAILFDGFCYMGWSTLSPGVTVSVENPYEHLMVNIDEQNLSTVISKLCSNASNYTTEGSIRAKYEYRHGELSIAIEDTGRGLKKEVLPHVFDRFNRDESSEQGGTGLDLPIVKELVEQMGGSIELQSEEGKGSSVYIIIPCEMSSMVKKAEMG